MGVEYAQRLAILPKGPRWYWRLLPHVGWLSLPKALRSAWHLLACFNERSHRRLISTSIWCAQKRFFRDASASYCDYLPIRIQLHVQCLGDRHRCPIPPRQRWNHCVLDQAVYRDWIQEDNSGSVLKQHCNLVLCETDCVPTADLHLLGDPCRLRALVHPSHLRIHALLLGSPPRFLVQNVHGNFVLTSHSKGFHRRHLIEAGSEESKDKLIDQIF